MQSKIKTSSTAFLFWQNNSQVYTEELEKLQEPLRQSPVLFTSWVNDYYELEGNLMFYNKSL